MQVLAEQSPPYQVDANGIPILPGYRKPFNSETARAAQLVGARVRRQKRLAKALGQDVNALRDVLIQVKALLESRRKSHPKPHLQLSSVAPISPTISPISVNKNASQVKPEGKNSGVAPIIAQVAQVKPLPAPPKPQSSGNQGVNPSTGCPAPVQAAIPPVSEIDDDCPF